MRNGTLVRLLLCLLWLGIHPHIAHTETPAPAAACESPGDSAATQAECLLKLAQQPRADIADLADKLNNVASQLALNNPPAARQLLQQFLKVARKDRRGESLASTLNLLGTLEVDANQYLAALAAFADAERLAQQRSLQTTARLNINKVLIEQFAMPRAIVSAGSDMDDQQLLVVAELQAKLGQVDAAQKTLRSVSASSDQSARLGVLASIAEQQQRLDLAAQHYRQAILASTDSTHNNAFVWHWRLAEIAITHNDRRRATLLFDSAIAAFDRVSERFWGLSDSAFREQIAPMYEQAAANLLAQARDQRTLHRVRQVLEQSRVAALENYFQDACGPAQPTLPEQPASTAVIYPLALAEQLHFVVATEDKLHHRVAPVRAATLQQLVQEMRLSTQYGLSRQAAAGLGQLLIGPIADVLESSKVTTLVFVDESTLQGLPLGALRYRGKMLAEHYALAITPSLHLTDSGAPTNAWRALSFGLTEGVQGFSPLPAVASELAAIDKALPGTQRTNAQFSGDALSLAQERANGNILHLATHARIAPNPQQSFVLAYDRPIFLNDVQQIAADRQILGAPLDLIVLSACETAVGDRRSALGFGGMAVRAGARSALASLWKVDDTATAALISEFYAALSDGHNKARALQLAQTRMLNGNYADPSNWAGFILLGNAQ